MVKMSSILDHHIVMKGVMMGYCDQYKTDKEPKAHQNCIELDNGCGLIKGTELKLNTIFQEVDLSFKNQQSTLSM